MVNYDLSLNSDFQKKMKIAFFIAEGRARWREMPLELKVFFGLIVCFFVWDWGSEVFFPKEVGLPRYHLSSLIPFMLFNYLVYFLSGGKILFYAVPVLLLSCLSSGVMDCLTACLVKTETVSYQPRQLLFDVMVPTFWIALFTSRFVLAWIGNRSKQRAKISLASEN